MKYNQWLDIWLENYIISGITDVTYKGEKVNIIEFLAGDSTVNTIFWCIFILAIGLTCIFTIGKLNNSINTTP